MKKPTKASLPLLGVCLFLILSEIFSTLATFRALGIVTFKYYTTDSNVLGGLSALLLLIFILRGKGIPKWVRALRLMATLCLTVTFLVVVFMLIPMLGGVSQIVPLLFEGAMLFHHLLCPLVSLLSFLFLENGEVFSKKDALLAMIPTFLYGGIFIPLNVLRLAYGPYPFLHVYEQPVFMSVLWCGVIFGGAYALARLILKFGGKRRGTL